MAVLVRARKPIIYQREESGLIDAFGAAKFGALGSVNAVTFHHSAGPRAKSKAQAQTLHEAFQRLHEDQGWGDIGYHLGIDDKGRIYRLRDRRFKGAHVGEHNTGNLGIMLHGNYMYDRLNVEQRSTLRWLFEHGHKTLTGFPDLSKVIVRGHREWPGHRSNLCPGKHLMSHIAWLRSR